MVIEASINVLRDVKCGTRSPYARKGLSNFRGKFSHEHTQSNNDMLSHIHLGIRTTRGCNAASGVHKLSQYLNKDLNIRKAIPPSATISDFSLKSTQSSPSPASSARIVSHRYLESAF